MLKHWQYKLVLGIALITGGVWTVHVGQRRSATLLALDTNTGKIQWFRPLRSEKDFYSRGAIASNGTVVLGSAESSQPEQRSSNTYRISAFDAQSGNPLWTTQLNSPVDDADRIGYWFASTYSLDLQPNAVYAQMGEELRSLDPRTGEIRWSIKRPWLNANDQPLRFGLGIAATEQTLAVLQLERNQNLLQVIDPETGKLIRQTAIAFDKLESTSNRITMANRSVFLETSGLIPSGKDSFLPSGQATLTAYNLDTGQIRYRVPISGAINNLQAVGQTIQISTDPVFDFKNSDVKVGNQLIGLDLETGRVLWKKVDNQLKCTDFVWSWRVDAESVYITCKRPKEKSSTIVSLSAQTGQIQWQTLVSPNQHSAEVPGAIADRQFLTFRRVQSQLQAIALDRQTGKLLWSKALFSSQDLPYMDSFRATVATDQDKVFVLDAVPQWQLWLLSLNRDWYLNPSIEPKP
ncbi:PQQ-binding-like beta-propeller repeat protein [Leptolyngbya sp. AN03gr2]|uniref:outer membrane protein assembly factor BamB family protein n=1 Tax=unclassified Leptolyngbya TaxID=2650499 RepID=UPI003D3119EF